MPTRSNSLRHALLTFAAFASTLAVVAPAQAQDGPYPARPITVVVGYPPGGSTDLTGRTLADHLARKLGVPVVVENLGGAGGAIGAQKVARAPADGYTLLLGSNNEIVINRLITPSTVKYSYKDFTPIGLVASQPMVLVAAPGAGVKDVDQFVRKVKAAPGRFSFGSSGVGTSLHLAGEMVKQQAGLFMTHIPYRGVAPLASDLIGGSLEYGVFVLSSGLPHIRSGKLVALGVTDRRRTQAAPDIPALAEHPALKGIDIGVWFALMAPANLPKPVFDKIKKALNDSLQSPDFRKKKEAAGSTVAATSVNIDQFLATEVAKYKQIVEFAKIEE